MDASVALASTPLSMLAAFGAPSLAGKAEANLSLTGASGAPNVKLELQVRGAAPAQRNGLPVPPADLDLQVSVASGALSATAKLRASPSSPSRQMCGFR